MDNPAKRVADASVANGLRHLHNVRDVVIALHIASGIALDKLDTLENELLRLERVVGGLQ